jgi:hypothetical protein
MVLRPIRASGGRTGASVCSGDCGLCCKERIEKVQGSRFGRVESLFFRPFGAVFAIFNSTHGSRRGLHSFAASRLLLLPGDPALGCIPSLLRGFYCSNASRLLLLQSFAAFIAPIKRRLAAQKSAGRTLPSKARREQRRAANVGQGPGVLVFVLGRAGVQW